MHPGPINRGVEITSDVADNDQSIILEQVEMVLPFAWLLLFVAEKIKRES